jgi:sugar lactone lactonase YvrE
VSSPSNLIISALLVTKVNRRALRPIFCNRLADDVHCGTFMLIYGAVFRYRGHLAAPQPRSESDHQFKIHEPDFPRFVRAENCLDFHRTEDSKMTLVKTFVRFSFLLFFTIPSFAQQLYFTNEPKESLEVLNLSTGVTTTLYNTAARNDDLTLDPSGNLIYTEPGPGTVSSFNPTTGVNTILASGLPFARDLEIEPGGQTMLIAVYSPGSIYRYNFSTGTVVPLAKKLITCDGIAYDGYGNLYAVANHNTIVQINPTTGAVMNTLTLEPHSGVNGGDGLTYDPYSGSLWATHDGTSGKGLIQILTNENGPTGFNLFLFTKTLTGAAPDGIKSDGNGNLYVGAIAKVFVYNIPTNTITNLYNVGGADGVSLVPGTY